MSLSNKYRITQMNINVAYYVLAILFLYNSIYGFKELTLNI